MRFAERMKNSHGAHYRIIGRYGRHSDDTDMALALGRKGDSWPDEGVPLKMLTAKGRYKELGSHDTLTWETPIKVWVDAKEGKPTFMRVKCECPGCHRTLPVGRLHQHVCKAGVK